MSQSFDSHREDYDFHGRAGASYQYPRYFVLQKTTKDMYLQKNTNLRGVIKQVILQCGQPSHFVIQVNEFHTWTQDPIRKWLSSRFASMTE